MSKEEKNQPGDELEDPEKYEEPNDPAEAKTWDEMTPEERIASKKAAKRRMQEKLERDVGYQLFILFCLSFV